MNSKFPLMKSALLSVTLLASSLGIAHAEQQYQNSARNGESERHYIASATSSERSENASYATNALASNTTASPQSTTSD